MSIVERFESLRRWGFRFKVIGSEEVGELGNVKRTLLIRVYLLNTKFFGIYLHYHINPDGAREPHNHPWSFITICLKGGYTESVYRPGIFGSEAAIAIPAQLDRIVRGSIRVRKFSHIHKVVVIKPETITLILRGPKVGREWGFFSYTMFTPSSYYAPNEGRTCLYGNRVYTVSCPDSRCKEHCMLLREDLSTS